MQIISKVPRQCPQFSECRARIPSAQAAGQPLASSCPHGPHQLVAVLENVTGKDPTGGVHHRLLHDVVLASGRRGVQWHLGNRWTKTVNPEGPKRPLSQALPPTTHDPHGDPRRTFLVSAHCGLTFQEFPKSTGSSSTWRLLLVKSLFWMPSKFPQRPHTCS